MINNDLLTYHQDIDWVGCYLNLLHNYFIIIIIKIESAVQGREGVRTLYQSEDPNPMQLTIGGRKREDSRFESIGSALKTRQSQPSNTGSPRSFQRDTERGTKVLWH